jgi:isocitrate/isopropylmalate dehydrogenase
VCVKGIPSPSPIGFLRKELDLFADVRPVRSFPGVWSLRPDIDMVCIREATEGFIADRNLYKGYGEFMTNKDQVVSLRVISREACERIARFAFEYARKNNRRKITALHKANVLKMGCGLFLESVQQVAASYPDIELSDESVDNAAGNLIKNPENYDVLLTTNLFGDILSDEAAGLVSSLVPTGNFGTSTPLFLPIDHSPQYSQEGKGTISPFGVILCSAMLLEHLGELAASNSVKHAIAEHLKDVPSTSLSSLAIARDICQRL